MNGSSQVQPALKNPADLRAAADRDLAERLLRDVELRAVIEPVEKKAEEAGARRQLLGTAMRLTGDMAPDVEAIIDECRRTLAIESPLETYVYPAPYFNAAAVRPEHGRFFILISSALLEAFEADELRFVVGHELGHHLFEHYRIPVVPLLNTNGLIRPGLALQLFAWQRSAEASADRTGLVCAGGLEPSARALFKLASGLRGGRIRVRIDHFLAQVGDLQSEASRLARADEPLRSDWFATHPFSPLRLRAAELFAASELFTPGGISRDELEAQTQDLLSVMEPSYLSESSDGAEAMRRLLFAGGVLIAAASGKLSAETLRALEDLLGPGSVSSHVSPDALRADLDRRIKGVKELVPPLRRAQVIRDLAVIARADGQIDERERAVLHEIADAVGIHGSIVNDATATLACDPHSP